MLVDFARGGGIFYIIIYSIFILETDNFHVQGEQIAFYQLMVGLFCGEFFNGCQGAGCGKKHR